MEDGSDAVGYGRPPSSTRFRKGQSGNPRGRPRNRRYQAPYDIVLGQMVTIRENGRERRVTAAEAFLLHLTNKGLQGDSVAARASLAAIEGARTAAPVDDFGITEIVRSYVEPGSVGCALGRLGMAIKRNKSTDQARFELKPWVVQAALDRLGERQLTVDEQREVLRMVKLPEQVTWPNWWSVRSRTSG